MEFKVNFSFKKLPQLHSGVVMENNKFIMKNGYKKGMVGFSFMPINLPFLQVLIYILLL